MVSLVGTVGTGLYILFEYISRIDSRKRIELLKENQIDIENSVSDASNSLEELRSNFYNVSCKLDFYRNSLGMSEHVSGDHLIQFLRDIQDLKRKIEDWMFCEIELKKEKNKLIDDLKNLFDLSQDLGYTFSGQELLEKDHELFHVLEYVIDHLQIADRFKSFQKKIEELDAKILELIPENEEYRSKESSIDKLDLFLKHAVQYKEYSEKADEVENIKKSISRAFTERVRKAFNSYFSDEEYNVLNAFGRVYDEYVSLNDNEREIKDVLEYIDKIKSEQGSLRDTRAALKNELKTLSNASTLDELQYELDDARSQLEPLAERYAVYRIAELILNNVHNRFIERTKDQLLGRAGKYFSKLTNGEYKEILPMEDLTIPDFSSIKSDGTNQKSIKYLSRATSEQLFLSVRLGRITDIEPPLPVIIDDSLVNFDSKHRKNAVEIIKDLSLSNQIFVLTAHPEIVQYLSEETQDIQYWKLDNGGFHNVNGNELIDHLVRG